MGEECCWSIPGARKHIVNSGGYITPVTRERELPPHRAETALSYNKHLSKTLTSPLCSIQCSEYDFSLLHSLTERRRCSIQKIGLMCLAFAYIGFIFIFHYLILHMIFFLNHNSVQFSGKGKWIPWTVMPKHTENFCLVDKCYMELHD